MSNITLVKSASATVVGLLSLAVFSGIASAETANVNSDSVIKNSETSIVTEVSHDSNSNAQVTNENIQSRSADGPSVDAHETFVSSAAQSISVSSSAQVNAISGSSGSDSNQTGQLANESNTQVQTSQSTLAHIVKNTTEKTVENTVLPLSAIAQRINDYSYSEQNNSSFSGPQPISKSYSTAPVSPAIPVEPQTPAGLLQQLSLILSQSPVVSFTANFAHFELYSPLIIIFLIVALCSFAAAKPASLFVSFLHNSGYTGAARSNVIAALPLFATPLKMSFITVRKT